MGNFPSHDINPQLKGEDWLYEMVSSIHNEWDVNTVKSFAKGARRYQLNELYSLGKQPSDIYAPMFEVAEDEDSSYINLDLSPPAIIPKFKRITMNRFAKIDFNVTAQAIDPYALEEKLDYEAEERANINVREMLDQLGVPADVLISGEVDQPRDEEELSIKMDYGYKHNQAIDIEKKVDAVFNHEGFRRKLMQARDSIWNKGAAGFKVDTDHKSGKVTIRPVDISVAVVSPTEDPFFKDIWYGGESILMTIDEVRRESEEDGCNISEDQFEELASKHSGINGNPKYFTHRASGAYAYDSCKVPVFDVEFLSMDTNWYEKRWDKRGNPVLGRVAKPKTKKDRTYYKDEKIVAYRAKWIPGTRIMWRYGLKNDMARVPSREWDTSLSYKFVAPELNKMETSPIVDNIIPIVDQICIAWYKLQNVVARARPRGIMIEIGALEDISVGDGGENMRPIDVLDMFTQTGILVYRKISLDGTASNYKPIEELSNGLGDEAAQYFQVIEAYMQKIRDMIGFNDITDGTTPDPKTLNGVASMAAEATNNALHHLFEAEKYLTEEVAKDVSIRVHDSIAFKKNSPYTNVLGPDVIKSIKQDKDKLCREFDIAIEYGADQFERQELNAAVEKALDLQQITIADKITVKRCRNLKQAEQILSYRVKKNAERMAEQQRRLQQENAEENMRAAVTAEEEKRKTLQMQMQVKIAEIQAKQKAEADNLILKYTLENNLIGTPDRESKQTIEKIRADATKESAKIKKSAGVGEDYSVPSL